MRLQPRSTVDNTNAAKKPRVPCQSGGCLVIYWNYWAVPELSLPHRNPFADIGVFPSKGLGCLLIEADVAQDLAFQVGDRSKDATIDHLALKLAEPTLDLIEPGGVSRREVQIHVGVLRQEILHQVRFVSGKVV